MKTKYQIQCNACSGKVSSPVFKTIRGKAFSGGKLNKSIFFTEDGVYPHWTWDEVTEISTPCGDPINEMICNVKSLKNTQRINQSGGCCNLDYFDVMCDCGVVLGHGGDDCWQDDACHLDLAVVTIVE